MRCFEMICIMIDVSLRLIVTAHHNAMTRKGTRVEAYMSPLSVHVPLCMHGGGWGCVCVSIPQPWEWS